MHWVCMEEDCESVMSSESTFFFFIFPAQEEIAKDQNRNFQILLPSKRVLCTSRRTIEELLSVHLSQQYIALSGNNVEVGFGHKAGQ